MHVALSKRPMHQLKPVQQSRQQALRAYYSNMYTLVLPFLNYYLTIVFVIHLRGHKFGSSNHRFGKGLVFEGGQAQVTNLDRSGGAGDENVVAFEISVNNRRRSGVQKMKAFENLSAPSK